MITVNFTARRASLCSRRVADRAVPWRAASSSSAAALERQAAEFQKNGVCVLEAKASPQFIDITTEACDEAFADAQRRSRLLRDGKEIGLGQSEGFTECVQRAKGRYDMPWKVDGNPLFFQPESNGVSLYESTLLPFAKRIMGEDVRLEFNGCLMSFAGAAEQLWHVDGQHLWQQKQTPSFNSDSSWLWHDSSGRSILPTHCLNLFVPLVDVLPQNGGTEFCLGSHFHTASADDEIVWQRDHWKDTIGFDGEVMKVNLNAGDVLAFDYRTLHRALEHNGQELRPVLYYTFVKPWFSDVMNFAQLPSLHEADTLIVDSRAGSQQEEDNAVCFSARAQYPPLDAEISSSTTQLFCDGAAGTQVPKCVSNAMVRHLHFRNANVGGNYATSEAALEQVTRAREAASVLLGTVDGSHVAFGQNCTNLMFHSSKAIELSGFIQEGDNVVLSRACHDANIAPWMLLAKQTGAEVRWIEIHQKGENSDELDSDLESMSLRGIVDERTRVVAFGLASNATGREHRAMEIIQNVKKLSSKVPPVVVLDATHYLPHHRVNLQALGADLIVGSAYKFFGPHIGVAGMSTRFHDLFSGSVAKVGKRYGLSTLVQQLSYGSAGGNSSAKLSESESDVLPADRPTVENCQISPWEMGTLNYEGLAGFEACVEQYLGRQLASSDLSSPLSTRLETAFSNIEQQEQSIIRRFIGNVQDLLDTNKLVLYGSRQDKGRTPTFALSAAAEGGDLSLSLVDFLNNNGVFCTTGNHYAPELVTRLGAPRDEVVRVSFLHYNSMEEVDKVTSIIGRFFDEKNAI